MEERLKRDCDSSLCAKVTLNHGRPVPAVLLANKSDQLPSSQLKLDSFCRENGFVGWFETSAKVGEQQRGGVPTDPPHTITMQRWAMNIMGEKCFE